MSEKSTVLDIIKTEDKTYIGVVDYVTTKYISMYDVSLFEDPDYRHLMILYKMYYSNMRFSIFIATTASHFDFGDPVMINKRKIVSHSKPLHITKPFRSVKKVMI
jgi:hypothetical protein